MPPHFLLSAVHIYLAAELSFFLGGGGVMVGVEGWSSVFHSVDKFAVCISFADCAITSRHQKSPAGHKTTGLVTRRMDSDSSIGRWLRPGKLISSL